MRKPERGVRKLAPRGRAITVKSIIHSVVTKGNAARVHMKLNEVVTVRWTTNKGSMKEANTAPLDEFLPPCPRPIDCLALGH
jgi:hypothetical protein